MDLASQLLGLQQEIERFGGQIGQDLFGDVACDLASSSADWSCPQKRLIRWIARRRRIDILRREGKRAHKSLEAIDDESRFAPNVSDELTYNEDRERIWDALRRLKPKYRDVIHLSYLDGLSDGEVAEALRIPRETVRTRLKRAIKQLRHWFSQLSTKEFRDE